MTQKSQYRNADLIVDRIHGVLGHYPGYRTLHADGRLYKGTFIAYDNARQYSRAVHLQGSEVPATVRFSKGGGNPHAFFSSTVGMATRFYLEDGRVTNLVMLSQKLFFANSVEQFVELVNSAQPLEPGGPVNKPGLDAFLATNPNVMNVFKMRALALGPISFGNTEFHAIHAFRYVDSNSRTTNVRCHWIPIDGVKGQPPEALTHESVDVLFREFETRLAEKPVEFELELEISEPGDPLDDATALWPDDRKRVRIGRLTLVAPTTEAEIGDALMNHDPTMLTDGIEANDDPILQIRRGVYEASAAQRSGGWRGPSGGQETSGT